MRWAIFFATLGALLGFAVPAHAALRGPDVSSYQGCSIDWGAVKRSGDAFAFVKATEGLTYHDACFGRNWHEIRAAGLNRGAYHFAHADSFRSPESECLTYLSEIRAHDDNLDPSSVPILDIEAGNLSGSALANWVDRWTKCVQDQWHRAGLVYTGQWFLGDRGAYVWGSIQRGWKLWTSRYGPANPPGYSGFPSWDFWQYTDGQFGLYPRSTASIGPGDISVYRSDDPNALRAFFNLGPDVPPEVQKLKDQIVYFWDHRPITSKQYDVDMNAIYWRGWQPHRSAPTHDWNFKPGPAELAHGAILRKKWAQGKHGAYTKRLIREDWASSHTRHHVYGDVRMPGFYKIAG